MVIGILSDSGPRPRLWSNLRETKLKRLSRKCKVDSCCRLQIIVVLQKGTFESKDNFDTGLWLITVIYLTCI